MNNSAGDHLVSDQGYGKCPAAGEQRAAQEPAASWAAGAQIWPEAEGCGYLPLLRALCGAGG